LEPPIASDIEQHLRRHLRPSNWFDRHTSEPVVDNNVPHGGFMPAVVRHTDFVEIRLVDKNQVLLLMNAELCKLKMGFC
jgi:hypothetical protein